MTINDLIVISATRATKIQAKNGSMPAGNNGPWKDEDTPVRNTAHWLITFIKAYEISGQIIFKQAALRAGDYLISLEARPMKAAFFCRKNPNKDFSNGLIGQAWAIQALIEGGKKLKKSEYFDTALEVFLQHDYDYKLHLWRGLNADGSRREINTTFNQQLWFGCMGYLLLLENFNESLEKCVFDFFRNYEKYLVLRGGLIIHSIMPNKINYEVRRLISKIYKRKSSFILQERSLGYHSFNLLALAILKRNCKHSELINWNSPKLKAAIKYCLSHIFFEKVKNNKYAFSYNPIGFEVPIIQEAFALNNQENHLYAKQLINFQLENHFNYDNGLLENNTIDPVTLAARIYEATYIDFKYEFNL